jgi:phosphinothricin acetyltransferase
VNLAIRQALPNDGAALARIYAPYILNAPTSFEEIAPTADEMAERVRQTLANWPYLVAEDDGNVVGYAYATSHRARASYRWSIDVTVYLSPTHHRRGIGRRLYQVLFPLLTAQGFVTAYAGITIPNASSIGLHEAMGFKLVGIYRNVGFKIGQWCDVGWWARPLSDPPPKNPAKPTPWAAMPQSQLGRISFK